MTAAQRPLTEHERSNILNRVLNEKLNTPTTTHTVPGPGGNRVWVPYGYPRLRKRGTTWAEVGHDKWPIWHPRKIFAFSMMTLLTCGLWGFFWLYQTFKKPAIYTVVVDEYGNYRWTQNPIPRVQKVERYILLAVMGFFALWVIGVIIGSGQNGSGQNTPKYRGETTSLSRTVRLLD